MKISPLDYCVTSSGTRAVTDAISSVHITAAAVTKVAGSAPTRGTADSESVDLIVSLNN